MPQSLHDYCRFRIYGKGAKDTTILNSFVERDSQPRIGKSGTNRARMSITVLSWWSDIDIQSLSLCGRQHYITVWGTSQGACVLRDQTAVKPFVGIDVFVRRGWRRGVCPSPTDYVQPDHHSIFALHVSPVPLWIHVCRRHDLLWSKKFQRLYCWLNEENKKA